MKKTLLPLSYLLPALAFAQDSTLGGLIPLVEDIIGFLTPVVVALALLYFFWGLAKFILSAGDEVDSKKGRDMMIWGIIALFVMVSVWGIINLLGDTLNIQQGDTIIVPSVPLN